MNTIPKKIEDVLTWFSKDIQSLFGEEVVSVILFGSAASDEYLPKKSDINFLVVLTPRGIEQIGKVQKSIKRWQKRRISPPLFLTKEYIQASLDSFPIEFLNMQTAYRVITGEDILAELQINKKDLRLQCERELKGKLLRLRQRFILTGGKTRELKFLIGQSIIAFTSIFRALLYLRGKEAPGTKQDVLIATCREFEEIEERLFSRLLLVRESRAKLSKADLEESVQKYISQIKKLSEAVDKMKFDKT